MAHYTSTVNENYSARVIAKFSSLDLVNAYRKNHQIDIARFVENDFYYLLECEKTKLRFFNGIKPGDDQFYASLMQNNWYYMPWKWEHAMTKSMLTPNDRLLEIGSGGGGFLKGIQDLDIDAVGLEINSDAIEESKNSNLNVLNMNFSLFADENQEKFDWVVSYQVLEHIQEVGKMLENSLRILKPGGRMVISVPNNQSFIKYSDDPLNKPPHHGNLWDENSLRELENVFACKIEHIFFEPLQDYHINWYVNTMLEMSGVDFKKVLPGLRRFTYNKTRQVLTKAVEMEKENIRGHSIMGIFRKL